jgi:HD-GYP domain-containing protein (c-di-GMP phosphodiesterase class II)
MGIPDAILNKPDKLAEKEWDVMKLHPGYGYEVLAPILFLQPAAEIVLCHHENWDGSGYPRGLKGKTIPLMARIVSLCNVWDALLSDQPYRKAWSQGDTRSYIEGAAGKLFDPEIVEAFIRFIVSSQ